MRKHIHLIGIGGTGLSAIAKILLEQGEIVSGSDMYPSIYFEKVTNLGAKTIIGHDESNILGADIVVRSSAIGDENPEVIAARNNGIPVLKRAEFLNQLIMNKQTLAIAGTHGKTTTTAMVIKMLDTLQLDPSFIIGAVIKDFKTNAHTGNGDYFVIEADEYDNMFLGLEPKIAIITNIEHDHPDCFPTSEDYLLAFEKFAKKVQPDGKILVCQDDIGINQLLSSSKVERQKICTYGTISSCEYQSIDIQQDDQGYQLFTLIHNQEKSNPIELVKNCRLSLPGLQNVKNATAALAMLDLLDLPLTVASNSLKGFSGTERRFDIQGIIRDITLIDDYAHHPTQIWNTIQAARQRFPKSRIVVVWEPHTYSRPAKLEKDFVDALSKADQVFITKIYAARETDSGYSPQAITELLPLGKSSYIPEFKELIELLAKDLKPHDILLVLSAGYGPQITKAVLQKLEEAA